MDNVRAIAEQVKRQTRNPGVLALCEYVLAAKGGDGCQACAARRIAKTAAQRRWRAKRCLRG